MTDIPTGFTPGPWIYAKDDGKACITTVARCGDYVIGLDSTPYEGGNYRDSALSPDDEEDARLIAAAPAMAEEIKRLRAENERLTKRVEWFTHAVHTCHDECDRPLCKTTRERDALRVELERKDAALRVGIKFMSIATDWNLCRVEIDRKWHSTYDLIDDLRAALSAQKEEEA